MKTPALNLTLACLLAAAAPAAKAAGSGAPDFEPMKGCSQNLYDKFHSVKSFLDKPVAESAAPAGAPDEKALHMLTVLNAAMSSITLSTDHLLWPMADPKDRPEPCRLDGEKIKNGVYGGLSELRAKINARGLGALPEDKRPLADALVGQERDADALMGDRSQSVGDFYARVSALDAKAGAFASREDLPGALRERAAALNIRLEEIKKRMRSSTGSSAPSAPPDGVEANAQKNVSGAQKRMDAVMRGGFGDSGGASLNEIEKEGRAAAARAAGAGAAGGAPGETPRTALQRRADLADRELDAESLNVDREQESRDRDLDAKAQGIAGDMIADKPSIKAILGATPSAARSGEVLHAVKNSATGLGGIINARPEDETRQDVERRAAGESSAARAGAMAAPAGPRNRADEAVSDMDAAEKNGINIGESKLTRDGSGRVALIRHNPPKTFEVNVKNWTLVETGGLTSAEVESVNKEMAADRREAEAAFARARAAR